MKCLFCKFTQNSRIHLLITAIIFLLFLTMLSSAVGRDKQVAQPDPVRFKQEINSFVSWDAKNSVPDNKVLFIGSSSVRLWATHNSFPDIKVINRGFGGSHISDVIYYSEQIVLPYKPELIVFYAGDNDITYGKTPRQVFRDYQRFVEIVRDNLPKTSIIYIGIKPSKRRWSYWPAMEEANEMIADLCKKDKMLYYFDSSSGLLADDGLPIEKMFLDDQLHLSNAGYDLWNANLKPLIKQVLPNK